MVLAYSRYGINNGVACAFGGHKPRDSSGIKFSWDFTAGALVATSVPLIGIIHFSIQHCT
jgi:hypothetical protein